jgi:hypothetical protein
MGNCQAAEAAAVIIQHPGGKVDRLYWSTTAAEVMRNNPGHYVALVILRVPADNKPAAAGDAAASSGPGSGGAKITRVKLLKPKDTLLLGQVYRLITAQGLLALSCPGHGLKAHGAVQFTRAILKFSTRSCSARRGDEGGAGEEEREDAAVRGHQAAARAAPARRRGSPELFQPGRYAILWHHFFLFISWCNKQLLILLWLQDGKQDKDRHRGRGRHWRPVLQSISESASQSSSSIVSESATS